MDSYDNYDHDTKSTHKVDDEYDSSNSRVVTPSTERGADGQSSNHEFDEESEESSDLDSKRSTRITHTQFSIDDEDDDDEDEKHHGGIEKMLKSIRAHEQEDLLSQEEENPEKHSSWSNRYSGNVDRHMIALTGGMTKDEVMSRLDDVNEESHMKNARNMYASSPYDTRAHEESHSASFLTKLSASLSGPGAGTVRYWATGFFRDNNSEETPLNTNLSPRAAEDKAMWMDVDLSGKASSLPPPGPAKAAHIRDWRSVVGDKKHRRRRRIIALILVLMVCILAIVYGIARNTGSNASVSGLVSDTTNSNALVCYVTSDIPFTTDDETRLHNDLISLPTDVDFVVHLGNIQQATVTLCPESTYEDASFALGVSPAPVFVLPGEEDWNNCPDPSMAWEQWRRSFDRFENKFEHDIVVERQLGRGENFAFVHKEVLFLGMRMVSGRVTSASEWDELYAENVRWTEQNLKDDSSLDTVRAVVIFGHARPSQRQENYFFHILDDVNRLGKPVLYVHANGGGIDVADLSIYTPYPQAPLLSAVQIEEGGKSAPARLSVGLNSNNPFQIKG